MVTTTSVSISCTLLLWKIPAAEHLRTEAFSQIDLDLEKHTDS